MHTVPQPIIYGTRKYVSSFFLKPDIGFEWACGLYYLMLKNRLAIRERCHLKRLILCELLGCSKGLTQTRPLSGLSTPSTRRQLRENTSCLGAAISITPSEWGQLPRNLSSSWHPGRYQSCGTGHFLHYALAPKQYGSERTPLLSNGGSSSNGKASSMN